MSSLKAFRSAGSRSRGCVAAKATKRENATLQQRGAALALATVLSTGCVADVAQANEIDVRTLTFPRALRDLCCYSVTHCCVLMSLSSLRRGRQKVSRGSRHGRVPG
jgi:hypothetical protein